MITFPTWITLSRLLVIPFILIGLQNETPQGRWIAATAFLLGAATDWLDGYLARHLNQVSDLGKVLDPLVDKLLVLAPLLSLIQLGQVPAWGVFLILSRDLAVTGWRSQTVEVSGANRWGKLKTILQILAVSCLILQLPGGSLIFWLSVAATLGSGALYGVSALRNTTP
jgi:CDP-diacylglycerol--glycerol-3-phosphate 3-phosphatidyltransferase